ncbi:MAG: LPS-assembly protein LptD [Firmicutes bacterium]|nr:LPS-assembly protein LptD [Bacillota bacterium]
MKKILSLLMLVIIINTFSAVAMAEVVIKGVQGGTWDFKNQLFMIEGGVEITIDETVITAESLIMDLDKEQIVIKDSAKATLVFDNVEGPIFFYGDQIIVSDEAYFIEEGKITSCDRDIPHYHLLTNRIELYPDDKLVIRGLVYYEGQIPIFYWPYIVIPIGEHSDRGFSLPEIGFGAEEGWYIKNSFNYFFNPSAHGTILADYYTLMGPGVGIRHQYSIAGEGSIYLYTVPRDDINLFQSSLEHRYEIGNFSLLFDGFYHRRLREYGVEMRTDLAFNSRYNTDELTFRVDAQYEADEGSKNGEAWNLKADWRQNLTENLRLVLDGQIQHKDYNIRRRMVNYLAELSYAQGDHTLTGSIQQRYNPDIFEEDVVPNWTSVNRIPEISWQWRNPMNFSGRMQVSVGNYREFPSRVESKRMYSLLELSSRVWRPTSTTSVSYSGNLQAFAYEESLFQAASFYRVGISQRFTTQLQASVNYSRRDVWGATPFRFDKQQPISSVTGQILYRHNNVSLTMYSGYDFITDRFQNLVTQVRINTPKGWSLQGNLTYNINNRTPVSGVAVIGYNPNRSTELKLGGNYLFSVHAWDRIDAKLQFNLTDTVSISYTAIYRPRLDTFTEGRFSLTKELHCRDITLSYDQVKRQVWFQYRIKAFPTMPIRLGGTDQGLLFDFEGLQDLMGVI